MDSRLDLSARRSALSPAKRALLEERLRGLRVRGEAAPRIPRRSDVGPAPLSFAQQRLWFLDQLAPGNPFYNIPAVLPLHMPLNVPALHRCINEIVRRHASLRTTFTQLEGQPVQRVATALEIPLPVIDLRSLPEAQREAEALRLAEEESRRPFDLSRGPLVCCTLLRLARDHHLLLLTMHHIVSDGWSMGVMFREMIALYEAFVYGRPSPLPELPIQYADFAVWQREWLSGEVLDTQLRYWRQRLDELPTLRLPTDRPRPQVASFRGAHHSWRIPSPLTARLRALGHAQGCTLFMVLLAAFKVLLSRYSGQEDVVVGTPIANRNRAEIEPLIGFFVNTLVLRSDLSGDPPFREVLARVREVTLGAYAHQDLPFEKLVEELQPERDLSRNPLCQVTLQIQNAPGATDEMPSGEQTGPEIRRGTSIFDIACSLWETTQGLVGGFEYSTDLFDAATIEQLADHFLRVLESVAADPELRVAQVPLLSPAERRRILLEWNATEEPFPTGVLLHELFEEQVHRSSGAVAVLLASDRLTYRELDRRANHLAHRLRALGVGPDRVVGICGERSPELVVGLLGILKAGGAYLPLDAGQPAQRLTRILDDAAVDVVLTQSRFVGRLPDAAARHAVVLDAEDLDVGLPSTPPPREGLSPEHLAYVLYTSGSTGQPKGVMIPHRAICNHMHWMRSAGLVTPEDRVLQRTPFTFDASVWEFFAPLLTGGRLVLLPPTDPTDTAAIVETVSSQGVTVLQLVPSLLRMLLQEPGFAACRSLQRVMVGGEELTVELQQRFFAALDAELHNFYGPTETTIDSLAWRCERDGERNRVPIGRPVSNTRAYLLDAGRQPVPIGVAGEIWIGGAAVGRGYLGQPELTAERFLPDPFAPDAGALLYRTGDLGRFHRDGTVEYLGRVDTQVKLRGYRIELGEIDATLQQHAAVRECLTLVREDVPGDQRLVSYAVLDPRYRPVEETAVARLQQERVAQWQTVFDEVYAQEPDAGRSLFDFTGWNSSYTAEPVPEAEMRRWLADAVDRVAALQPGRVLEIGCGTGLLLFQLAPRCTRYLGLDLSPTVLDRLRARIAGSGLDLGHVELWHRAADDLDGIEAGAFDLVILNSVVQYFPSVDYLVQVLRGALRRVAPGGFVFLGDLYGLPLQEAFHASVELWRAPDETPLGELRDRVRKRQAQTKELALDPGLFSALRHVFPELSGVWIQPKRGTDANEITLFRYDVTLQVRGSPPAAHPLWLDWQRQQLSAEEVLRVLRENRPEVLGVARVPDGRVAADLEAARLLASPELQTAGELRRARANVAASGPGPDWWAEAADRLAYDVELRWLRGTADGTLDLLFRSRDSRLPRWAVGPAADTVAAAREATLHHFANNPLQASLAESALPVLRRHLQESLPDYMVPPTILLLERLPLRSNGKVDRAALPVPDYAPASLRGTYVAPRTGVEEVLAAVWSEVLDVPRVGIHDNFFTDLGGHSLLATQLASRVRETFQDEVPLRMVFEQPTVAALAEAMLRRPGSGARLERLAELLLQMERMTEDELAAMAARVPSPRTGASA